MLNGDPPEYAIMKLQTERDDELLIVFDFK